MFVRYHYTRQATGEGQVTLTYYPVERMVADMLKKAPGNIKFERSVVCCGMLSSK